ncbi:DUF1932 domain-containing protein [Streptantibioticus parmotrematis]|uniref:DUF1932 domain-containing protein n=1 Tax=Streptantibioticus parmotrematis TaxID=2873249 RepID=UPI0027DFA768|nr:DUF1932 domain-containing protein [Streptantibioticus parmotrematis]
MGILHPGSMGAAVAGQAALGGAEVLWCPDRRSSATQKRAARYGLTPVSSLAELSARADIILSICPPAAAREVAEAVAETAFSGIYVEGNAVAPTSTRTIKDILTAAGACLVDGALVGSPPSEVKGPRFYLAGPTKAVDTVAQLFTNSAVDTHFLSGELGKASALKLSYSSYQKTSRVLAAVAYALARDHGVEQELVEIANQRTTSYLSEIEYIPKTHARSWRWGSEMREAEQAINESDLPAHLVSAAARLMEHWKLSSDFPSVEESLDSLHCPRDVSR